MLTDTNSIAGPEFPLLIDFLIPPQTPDGRFRIYATRPKARRNEEGYLLNDRGEVILGHPSGLRKNRKIGKPFLPPGNAPQRDWRTPGAVLEGEERHPQADKVRVLHRDARRHLVYGYKESSKSQRPNERAKADELLLRLERAGQVVVEKDVTDLETGQKGWRILEVYPENAG